MKNTQSKGPGGKPSTHPHKPSGGGRTNKNLRI